jgi:hypothetical protein
MLHPPMVKNWGRRDNRFRPHMIMSTIKIGLFLKEHWAGQVHEYAVVHRRRLW